MIIQQVTDVPISGAVRDDKSLDQFVEHLESGDASLVSPCEEMYIPWSDDEKRRLDRAVVEICASLRK